MLEWNVKQSRALVYKMDQSLDDSREKGYVSPCWLEDGTFHPVCMVVISVGIVVFFISIACIYQITKLCRKLSVDTRMAKEAEAEKAEELFRLSQPNSNTNLLRPPLPNHVDRIDTVETSFITNARASTSV